MSLEADIPTRFPDIPTADITKYYAALSFADDEFWKRYYCFDYVQGDEKSEAILNLTAHLITIEAEASSVTVKDVASQSVGSVSESFVQHDGTFSGEMKEFFNGTKYGQRFITIVSTTAGGGVFV